MRSILAICGSTRASSTNLSLIKAIIGLSKEHFSMQIFEGLSDLPHFNPDNDIEPAPKNVSRFREQIKQAEGILICTPEYAMGVPGTLKNAIDWTVSSCEFSHKPVALITASSVGEKGHASFLETLKIIECNIPKQIQLLISHAQTKISKDAVITDEKTLNEIIALLQAFDKLIVEK